MSFTKKFTENLLERDYHPVPKLCDSPSIGNESKYITFFKYSGTAVYAITLINTILDFDYKTSYLNIRNSFYSHAKSIRCAKAYCIGLFVGNNDELTDFCTIDIDDYTAFTTEIRWIIDLDNNKLVVKGSQPDKIIDLKELILNTLEKTNDSYSPETDIQTLVQNERDKRIDAIKSNNSIFTLMLIAVNCFALILTYLSGGLDNSIMLETGAIDTSLILSGNEYYRLFTSMFLHYGVMHLASNMLFLYVFGSSIERYLGKLKFLIIYIGSGIVGGILFCLVSQGIAAGASGAVFGLIGAVLAYSLKTKRSVDGKDTYFMIMFVIVSLFGGFLDIDVANSAHIGGFLFGLASGFLIG